MDYSDTATFRQPKKSAPRRRPPAFARACACPGCLRHVARLEEFNAQLARANDALQRERDQLAEQLAEREAA